MRASPAPQCSHAVEPPNSAIQRWNLTDELTKTIKQNMKRIKIVAVLFALHLQHLSAEVVTMFTVGDGNSSPTNIAFQATSAAYTNTYSSISNTVITASITVRSGETLKVLFSAVQNNTVTFKINGLTFWRNSSSDPNLIPVFVGPGTLSMISEDLGSSSYGAITAQITRTDEPFVPNGAVLVPADSAGPVNVLLESSTNLVAWHAALPGTYGTTSQNQYFRVRAVRQSP